MKIRLNLKNFVLITGEVNSLKKTDTGASFYLKGSVDVPVKVNDLKAVSGLKNGEWVCVKGKIRHSTERGTYKIISGKITPISAAVVINCVFIEGYLKKDLTFSTSSGILTADISHWALNPKGDVYPLPISIDFRGTRATVVKEIIKPDTLFEFEGRLAHSKEHGYYILGDYVVNREPIMREV